jgi:hypothetical protein
LYDGAQEIQSIICLCGREVVLATIKAKQQIVFILSKRSDEREREREREMGGSRVERWMVYF